MTARSKKSRGAARSGARVLDRIGVPIYDAAHVHLILDERDLRRVLAGKRDFGKTLTGKVRAVVNIFNGLGGDGRVMLIDNGAPTDVTIGDWGRP